MLSRAHYSHKLLDNIYILLKPHYEKPYVLHICENKGPDQLKHIMYVHIFIGIGHEILSTTILRLQLISVRQLSVTVERICTQN